MPQPAKDHYAPLDPEEAVEPIEGTAVVYLGPFCDEEHAREELLPLLAGHGARLESPDEEEVGEQLFNAELLTTSEGLWVGLEAACAGGCSSEFTDYGFQAVSHYDAGGELDGSPIRYRVHPLGTEGGALVRLAAINEYPADGPGDAFDGAAAELRTRGNTQQCDHQRLIVEQIPV